MPTAVHWLLEVKVKPGKADAFNAVMGQLVTETNKESGTLGYEWNFTDDKSTCYIYERFADSDAALIHLNMFGSQFADPFLDACDPAAITVMGNPTQALRDAIPDFSKVVSTYAAGFARFAT